MGVEIKNEMIKTFVAHKHYTPVYDGKELEPEVGDAAVSLRNLEMIKILPMGIVNNQGETLIVLQTGEAYYAPGLPLRSIELAQYLADHHKGQWTSDQGELLEALQSWPADLNGPVSLPSSNG